MEMQDTPWDSGGISMESITTGARSMPSIRGMEKPHTSASTMAVFLPRLARLTARLVVTDDLPTPPLPEATSRTRVLDPASAKGMVRPSAWPWAAWLPAVALGSPTISSRTRARSSSLITSKVTSTDCTSSRAWTASPTRRWISFFSGQPGTVRATSTRTDAPLICTERTMPRSTMLRCSSGSSTGRSASMIWDSVGTVDLPGGAGERHRDFPYRRR